LCDFRKEIALLVPPGADSKATLSSKCGETFTGISVCAVDHPFVQEYRPIGSTWPFSETPDGMFLNRNPNDYSLTVALSPTPEDEYRWLRRPRLLWRKRKKRKT
jgi:hypothetical protein